MERNREGDPRVQGAARAYEGLDSKITIRLLNLLGKIVKEVRKLEREHAWMEDLLREIWKSSLGCTGSRRATSTGMIPGRVLRRIVSISKPEVRLIVRVKKGDRVRDKEQ